MPTQKRAATSVCTFKRLKLIGRWESGAVEDVVRSESDAEERAVRSNRESRTSAAQSFQLAICQANVEIRKFDVIALCRH